MRGQPFNIWRLQAWNCGRAAIDLSSAARHVMRTFSIDKTFAARFEGACDASHSLSNFDSGRQDEIGRDRRISPKSSSCPC